MLCHCWLGLFAISDPCFFLSGSNNIFSINIAICMDITNLLLFKGYTIAFWKVVSDRFCWEAMSQSSIENAYPTKIALLHSVMQKLRKRLIGRLKKEDFFSIFLGKGVKIRAS